MNIWKIKWENIITPFIAICLFICLIGHINNYGFDFEIVGILALIYVLLTTCIYIGIYGSRKDMLSK